MIRIALLLALSATPALADGVDTAVDMCEAAPLPPEPWTSWNQSGAEMAGGEATFAPRLILGKPVIATLRPAAQVQFAVKPERQQPKRYGGLFTIAVKTPARVGIGLSGDAWIDVAMDRSLIAPVAHGDGPECSGIRKIVWFDIPAGVHLIQLSGSSDSQMRMMAADAIANQPLAAEAGD